MEKLAKDTMHVEYATRSVVTASITITVIITYVLAMNVLFISFALQAPLWLVTVLFFIVIIATIELLSSETIYRVTKFGLEREIVPRHAILKKLHRKYLLEWNSVKSYRIECTINRQGREYPFLKVIDNANRTLTIAGKSLEDTAFISFSETFEVCIASCEGSTGSQIKSNSRISWRIVGFILLVLAEAGLIALILILNTRDTPRLLLRMLATLCIPTLYAAIRIIRR